MARTTYRLLLFIAAIATLSASLAHGENKLLLMQQPPYPITYPEHLRHHIAYLDGLPADGITVTVFATFNLMKRGQAFTAAQISQDLAPIANRCQRLDYNFLLLWIDKPEDVFDDGEWAQVVANWRAGAIAARDAGFARLLFDIEEYGERWLRRRRGLPVPLRQRLRPRLRLARIPNCLTSHRQLVHPRLHAPGVGRCGGSGPQRSGRLIAKRDPVPCIVAAY